MIPYSYGIYEKEYPMSDFDFNEYDANRRDTVTGLFAEIEPGVQRFLDRAWPRTRRRLTVCLANTLPRAAYAGSDDITRQPLA